jgi:hypothetical protein
MKFRSVLILCSLAFVALGACGQRTSDEEQVRELIASAEKSAEARDSSDVLDLVADDYSDAQGSDKAALANFLRAYFLSHPKLELIVNVESVEFPAEGLAQAVVSVATVELSNPDMERLSVELRRHDGEWRVARADRAGQR